MKHHVILLLIVIIPVSLNAQKKYIDSAVNNSTLNAENHAITGVSNQVNKGIDNVLSGSVFKKKNKPNKQDPSSDSNHAVSGIEKGKSEILIDNTTYPSLSNLSEIIKSNQQVTNVEKTFSNGTGSLKVSHNGTPDELLDDLVKKAGDKFEVLEVTPGKIHLKMK